MEIITSFYETYISTELLLLIIFSGIFITKYTKGHIWGMAPKFKVLITSIIFSVGLYFYNDEESGVLVKYGITYFFATSFYELLAMYLTNYIKAKLPKENKVGLKNSIPGGGIKNPRD